METVGEVNGAPPSRGRKGQGSAHGDPGVEWAELCKDVHAFCIQRSFAGTARAVAADETVIVRPIVLPSITPMRPPPIRGAVTAPGFSRAMMFSFEMRNSHV